MWAPINSQTSDNLVILAELAGSVLITYDLVDFTENKVI